MLDGIAHVELAVRDLEKSRSLYERLGLAPIANTSSSGNHEAVLLAVGPSVLELRQTQKHNPGDPNSAPAEQVNEPIQPPVVDHFALLVSDMATTYETLESKNIPTLGEPASTAIGHRNMQRTLLAFEDPDGLHVQISETIDPRPHAEQRKAAKRQMADSGSQGLFGGFDHISTYCRDFAATQAFFREHLGLEEFFRSTTREAGTTVADGFAQAAFAVGGTDIELATAPRDEPLRTGVIKQLSFWAADVEACAQSLRSQGVEIDGPGEWSPVEGIRYRALSLRSPDALAVRIVQR